jgi:hypothetical protein
MTGAQLRTYLIYELDKQTAGSGQAFIDAELDYFLSVAYRNVYQEKVMGLASAKTPDIRDKYYADLAPLMSTTAPGGSNFGIFGLNAYSVEVPARSALWHLCDVCTSDYWGTAKEIQQEDAAPYMETNYNRPYFEQPVFYTVKGTNLRYIVLINPDSTFQTMIVTSLQDVSETIPSGTLPVPWWNEIVQRAASLALENIESGRTQSHLQADVQLNP